MSYTYLQAQGEVSSEAVHNNDCEAIKVCHWAMHEDDHSGEVWVSTCGLEWSLNEGAPKENGMNYCCKCGNILLEVSQ